MKTTSTSVAALIVILGLVMLLQQIATVAANQQYIAAIPQDRTVCDQLGSRLAQNELLAEKARFMPATMRIRKGVVRQSPEARGISPVFISLQNIGSNESSNSGNSGNDTTCVWAADDVRGAYATAASVVTSFGIHWLWNDPPGGDCASNNPANTYWERIMPIRKSPSGAAPVPIADDDFAQGLARSGIYVWSQKPGASLSDLMNHLSLGQLPVVIMAACRNNTGVPWPLVWGPPYEKFGIVVGIDLDLVYIALPSLTAKDAIAIPRNEFLMRWHHSRSSDGAPVQRWVAAVFRPFNDSSVWRNRFAGVMRLLDSPPQVLPEESICTVN